MRRSAGFTLLEMLIVVGLMAMLMVFVTDWFRGVRETTERSLIPNRRDRLTEVVLDRMERELAGTLLLALPDGQERSAHPWLFEARDGVFDGQDADELRFVTETPARVDGTVLVGGFRMVSYAPRTDRDGVLGLFRAEEALPDELRLDLPPFEEPPVVSEVAQFSLRLIDESGSTLDTWSSAEEAQQDQLPQAIEITLQLNTISETGEPVPGVALTRRIPLVVRPLGADDAQGCDGPTVAECVSRFAELIEVLGPGVQAAIDRLLEEVDGSACYTPGGQSEEIQALSAQLLELTQLDPAEVCQ